jgi:chromatin segregation and condensation protein Rec8/ScpA/Scc1 (kleisin family)
VRLSKDIHGKSQVLKSNGLVDVQQEEPYGDISLKPTPTLSKAEI